MTCPAFFLEVSVTWYWTRPHQYPPPPRRIQGPRDPGVLAVHCQIWCYRDLGLACWLTLLFVSRAFDK